MRLGVRVGRHDAFRADDWIVLQLRGHALDAALDLLDRKFYADHAGGTHEHAIRRRAELARGGRGHASRVLEAALARRDVAEPAVRDDRAQRAPANRFAPENDRRAGKLIARE